MRPLPGSARLAVAALGACMLAACATPAPKPTYPELTWTHLAPFKLNVAEVEVVSEYEPPFKDPNVEHLFPLPPEQAARRWARDRIVAAGTEGRARVVIKRASVVEVPLELTEGVRGYFTTEQAQRYDAVVEVAIEVRGPRGYRDGFATAQAERSRTVPEDVTLNERERIWFDITEALMKDFDAEMDRNIRRHLQRFLM
jgi:hypothetical protein